MPVHRERLEAGLARLASRSPDEVAIDALVDEAVRAVHGGFGLGGAGLLLVDEQQALRCVAATDDAGLALEELQEEAGEGPCVECLVRNTVVRCGDIGTDPRYPGVGPALAARGVHAVLGAPVAVGGLAVGSLNVYVDERHDWTAPEQQALTSYGELLGRLLAAGLVAQRQTELAGELQYALEYRVVIERAIGYLMARHGLDPVTAFNGLRRAARDRRRRVADVADEVLRGAAVG
jgi:GAF domain-containing protein